MYLYHQQTGQQKVLNREKVKLVDPNICWDEHNPRPIRSRAKPSRQHFNEPPPPPPPALLHPPPLRQEPANRAQPTKRKAPDQTSQHAPQRPPSQPKAPLIRAPLRQSEDNRPPGRTPQPRSTPNHLLARQRHRLQDQKSRFHQTTQQSHQAPPTPSTEHQRPKRPAGQHNPRDPKRLHRTALRRHATEDHQQLPIPPRPKRTRFSERLAHKRDTPDIVTPSPEQQKRARLEAISTLIKFLANYGRIKSETVVA